MPGVNGTETEQEMKREITDEVTTLLGKSTRPPISKRACMGTPRRTAS
ncbi:MAG: hypothetical protein IJ138_08265 [Clostridia bacterium]|nr:hypothetical protein [Clostridia bacterium]